ncbi:MAG TPA: isochorismatase family cysteine hydrolase [Ktedonobacterales bacterium]|nr:isochorismatase family cysteine hydrolase [Ktedonobacterales bacterium]
MASPLTLDRAHTALLIMDYQNVAVTRFGGAHPGLLDRAASVLAAARSAGVPIIYIVVRFREGYPEISPRNRVFAQIGKIGSMQEGDPATEIHPQVAPRPGDVVVSKRRTGAFSTTDLETILRAQERTTLILLGIATSGVVLSTVRWAADMDYDLIVVEDCCADGDEEVHRVLTQKVFPRQALVVTSDALLEAFGPASSE